jgi:hypothetical protein
LTSCVSRRYAFVGRSTRFYHALVVPTFRYSMYARSLASVRTYIHSQCTNMFSFCRGDGLDFRPGVPDHERWTLWRAPRRSFTMTSPQLASAPPPLHIIRSHTSAISALFISSDNERIYSGDISGLAVITSTRSFRPLASWKAHTDGLLGLEEWGKQVITSVCDLIIVQSPLAS